MGQPAGSIGCGCDCVCCFKEEAFNDDNDDDLLLLLLLVATCSGASGQNEFTMTQQLQEKTSRLIPVMRRRLVRLILRMTVP